MEVAQTLKKYFGHDTFLPGQHEIVDHVLAGHDALILMPTGGGKSLTYQLPALLLPGVTIVISPLIALMQDQVDRLQANGIAATFINSSLNPAERSKREQAFREGKFKLVYVAPERLMTPEFRMQLEHVYKYFGISLIAVDEAHCVSEWGHDFRPEYRQIGSIRTLLPKVPMQALTATATERVRDDILAQLQLRNPHIHIASFNRPNLTYEVRQKSKASYREILDLLKSMPNSSVIIYCQSRKSVDMVSESLQSSGIAALPYHAGMANEQRAENQSRFIRDDVTVLVATIAFGMGISKPDVRAVIHYDLPRSLEGYYQESGRAGRDGLPAQCLLYYNYGDKIKIEFMIEQKPDEHEQMLARRQLDQVLSFCESHECRRRILLRYFGEVWHEENCGHCDNCLRAAEPSEQEDRTIDAQKFLSCVARTEQRFGMSYVIDVLRGANTKKIRDFRHDTLSTYGIGKDYSVEEWKRLGHELIKQGFLDIAQEFSILHLNARSREILRKQCNFSMPARVQEERARVEQEPLDYQSARLFQHLRNLRKQIADDQGVPPYVIFSDAALREMAQQRPQTRGHFASISGVGSSKLATYFTSFTEEIASYCERNNLPMELVPASTPSSASKKSTGTGERTATSVRMSPSHRQTLSLFEQGLEVTEIAEQRGLALSTITSHLVELVEAGEPVDTARLVPEHHYQPIADAIAQVGDAMLRSIRDYVGEDYPYSEIRIVRAMIRQTSLTSPVTQ